MKKLLYVIAVLFVLAYVPSPAPTSAATTPAKIEIKQPLPIVEKASELDRCLADLQAKIDSNDKK